MSIVFTEVTMQYLTSSIKTSRIKALFVALSLMLATFIVAPSAQATDACTTTTVRAGATGTCVVQLQDALSVRGIPSGRFGSDGHFGGDTTSAVKEFQRLYGLVADGVPGPKTRATIAANPKPHPKILAQLTPRWSESGTIAIVDKIGVRGTPAVSNVARVYLFRDAKLIRTIQARTGGRAYDKVDKVWRIKNTPLGSYTVKAKDPTGYSNRYDAAMPWFVIFNGDIGFHYSPLGYRVANYGPSYPYDYGSMGCVNIGNEPDAILIDKSLTIGRNQVVVQ